MNPDIWGKHMWASIHFVALGYPDTPNENDKKNYHTFYSNLQNILPCKKCREHLKENLRKNPLYSKFLDNKDELFKWTVELHNIVNKDLNKKEITLETAKNIYMIENNFKTQMCPNNNDNKQSVQNEKDDDHLFTNMTIIVVFICLIISIIMNIYCVLHFIF